MNILIVTATLSEIKPSLRFFEIQPQDNKFFYSKKFLDNNLSFLITGIGCYSMIYNLTKELLKNQYNIVINVGIAGAFDNKKIKLTDVVFVEQEEIGDLGIDNNGIFRTLFEEKFANPDQKPFTAGKLVSHFNEYFSILPHKKIVKSLTVNTVSGQKEKISLLTKKFDADIENMEGAAFFYICLQEQVPFVEMRAISNFVEPRSKENWEIMAAIQQLNDALRLFLFEVMKM
jgi:futalosine hydrolase